MAKTQRCGKCRSCRNPAWKKRCEHAPERSRVQESRTVLKCPSASLPLPILAWSGGTDAPVPREKQSAPAVAPSDVSTSAGDLTPTSAGSAQELSAPESLETLALLELDRLSCGAALPRQMFRILAPYLLKMSTRAPASSRGSRQKYERRVRNLFRTEAIDRGVPLRARAQLRPLHRAGGATLRLVQDSHPRGPRHLA